MIKQPAIVDISLLILRAWFFIELFTDHGFEKLVHFKEMVQAFPDPLNFGKVTSLIFALLSDAIFSLLVALELFTRFSALVITLNLLVAFVVFWRADITNLDGEIPFLYAGGYLVILICGAGRFSLDSFLQSGRVVL